MQGRVQQDLPGPQGTLPRRYSCQKHSVVLHIKDSWLVGSRALDLPITLRAPQEVLITVPKQKLTQKRLILFSPSGLKILKARATTEGYLVVQHRIVTIVQ